MSKLLDEILSNDNMNRAYKAVKANKGASGIDNVTIDDLYDDIRNNWKDIKALILKRSYYPKPVRRVQIPKPNGSKRDLGIPTAIDRVIQQAMVQVLSPICENHFSNYSYGFRPNRSAQTAIIKLLEYFNDEYTWIVDIDLEKFFDNVPQDKLMSYAHNIIKDGDVESLIFKYLRAGVMINGKKHRTLKGTPQGGNLSPLLSNIILNELDKELEGRGLHFVRYADDVVIALKSEASAKRVMSSITKWIEKKLGLKVNITKTKIVRPNSLKYLGHGFYFNTKEKKYKPKPHQDSVLKFKRNLKKLTIRKKSIELSVRVKKLNEVIRGWINYFRLCDMKSAMENMDSHLRTRIRMIIWKQWKVPSKRQWGLQKLGINKDLAKLTSYIGNRYYWVVTKTCVVRAISKKILDKYGLISLVDYYSKQHILI